MDTGNVSCGTATRRRPRAAAHAWLATALIAALAASAPPGHAAGTAPIRVQRIATQYVAALGDPGASAGTGAQAWGLWRLDPGPRGVWLDGFDRLLADDGIAPARWRFDGADWWLEEHGLIMEQPEFPIPPGRYLVTGDREATTVLTVHRADPNGDRRWELADGVTLHDVTHLACRAARYTPAAGEGSCSPAKARPASFPVAPGASMPPVEGCAKQDYAVLFVIGVVLDD